MEDGRLKHTVIVGGKEYTWITADIGNYLLLDTMVSGTSGDSNYSFVVDKKAGKTEIRKAIERIYGVHVVGISTINAKEKLLSRGSRYKGKIGAFKKAIVTLREGEVINLFAE